MSDPANTPLSITPCTGDFEKSAQVIRESFITVAEEFHLTRENAATNGAFLEAPKLQELFEKGIALFDVFEGDAQIGFVALENAGSGVFYMEKLAVLPEKRHRGIGRRLIDFAVEYVRREGGHTISITVIDENTVLKQWYERYGFSVTQIKKFGHLPFTVCFMALQFKA